MTTTWTLRELPIAELPWPPSSVTGSPVAGHAHDNAGHGAAAGLLRGYVQAMNVVLLDTWGRRDFERGEQEVLGSLHDERYNRAIVLLAVADSAGDDDVVPGRLDPGRVLGYAGLELPVTDNTHGGYLDVGVRPQHRRQGIGSALHEAALARARAEGRTVLHTSTDQRTEPPAGPGALTPSTGTGHVDGAAPAVRFARARGWSLEQVARHSVLELPLDVDDLAARRTAAQRRAGDDYRVLRWEGPCPARWVDQFADLNARMSTDAPVGGLDLRAEAWDAQRVRDTERSHAERGLTRLVAAVEHVPTGTLAAYTALLLKPEPPDYADQWDTLVHPEHRGHRLGMLVKTANLQHLAELRPRVRRIGTWNAEENAYMLAINVELGFRPAGGSGEWQLTLS